MTSVRSSATRAQRPSRNRRRDKAQLSCTPCRQKKRRCDRNQPCNRCTRVGQGAHCVYVPFRPSRPSSPDHRPSGLGAFGHPPTPTTAFEPGGQPLHHDGPPARLGTRLLPPSPNSKPGDPLPDHIKALATDEDLTNQANGCQDPETMRTRAWTRSCKSDTGLLEDANRPSAHYLRPRTFFFAPTESGFGNLAGPRSPTAAGQTAMRQAERYRSVEMRPRTAPYKVSLRVQH